MTTVAVRMIRLAPYVDFTIPTIWSYSEHSNAVIPCKTELSTHTKSVGEIANFFRIIAHTIKQCYFKGFCSVFSFSKMYLKNNL